MTGCISWGQHPEGVLISEALGWPPAPGHQQHPRGGTRRGSPFPRKRPPSRLLPRSGCIFEVGDFLTPPLREC